jgi:hypothetical protein
VNSNTHAPKGTETYPRAARVPQTFFFDTEPRNCSAPESTRELIKRGARRLLFSFGVLNDP